ncbi:MAG: hypothetical protein IK025_11295 [Bacteroidales bacterium]|nr:hypothetical protein [Bacteroidales bacterium]
MKRTVVLCLVLCLICLVGFQGCSNDKKKTENAGNAIYYWRTIFRMNDYERDFLKKHDIKKMYVKFFDVDKSWEGDQAVPLGTTIFLDSIPQNLEIVPTVFISSEAIADYPQFIDKLLARVIDMADVNGIKFGEMQIDCDWTESHADEYFSFMKELKKKLDPKGIALSTTVRMFQLGYEIPAADYGVLMCYNTGDIRNWETNNSILDTKDVEPYLGKLGKYKLPLSVAFPCFSWDVTFSDSYDNEGEKYMRGIEYDKYDLSDTERFKKLSANKYEINIDEDDYWTPKYVRHEEVSLDEILDAKNMILKNLPSSPTQIVMYHLDSVNLSKLSDDDVEKIYR